jgi:plasmid replication initiation protein
MQLELTAEEVNIILRSLSEQPYKAVANVISNLHKQAQSQIEEKESTEKEGQDS